MYIWKTVKVFLSSTFLDLELERDRLGRVFLDLKQKLSSRHLSLIPYDLRWREKHSEELLARWCLEMVKQCQYFVGILGFRYGWRPPEDAQGKANDRRLSITEMEIRQALDTIAPQRRLLCLGDMAQYKTDEIGKERQEDLESVERLKRSLCERGENVYFYGSAQELLQIIADRVGQMIDLDYPPDCKVKFESYTRKDALQEIIEEKIRGFSGRVRHLERIMEFALGKDDKNYLAVVAIAGTGKSALIAKFATLFEKEHGETPSIVHIMSMGGDSRQVTGMLAHIGEQMQKAGILKEALSDDPVTMRSQIRQSLEKHEGRLLLVIDGLDEMEEEGKELSWLSRNLPNDIRVVLTTRPVPPWDILQTFGKLSFLNLPPMEEEEILEVIHHYDYEHGLNLGKADKELLKRRASGSPLYLKVALEEIVSSGIAVGQLATSVDSLFEQILKRLQQRYGANMIEDYLGLIAASRSGLAESELHELLSESDLKSIVERERTGTGLVDDLLIGASKSLDQFVIKRGGLLNFFHPEFERSIKERLGKGNMRQYHQRLADYFRSKGLEYTRGLFEICHQTQQAQEYESLLRLLTDLRFLQAKCDAGMSDDLLVDMERAVEHPESAIPSNFYFSLGSLRVNRETIRLLGKAMKLNLPFLRRHPDLLLQTLWNYGYWYDCPQASGHYARTEQGALPPWEIEGEKFYRLVERWREEKESGPFVWLKSIKPMELSLDTPLIKILKGHDGWITSVSVSPDGKQLLSASHDQTIKVWDMQTGECVQTIRGHSDKLTGVSFLPDGKHFVSCSEDKTLRFWRLENGTCLRVFEGHQSAVLSIAVSRHGKYVASGSKDCTIRIWSMENGECIRTLQGHGDEVSCVCFAPDDKTLASGSSDITLRIWDVETGECLRILEGHKRRLYTVTFSPDGRFLASSSRDDTACIWDTQRWECKHRLAAHEWGVLHVSFSPDGKKLVTGSGDKTLCLWDVETGEKLKRMMWHERSVVSTQFTPDGKWIVSGSYDKSIRIWNAESRECALVLKGHEEWARVSTFSEDGKWVASGSTDKKICFWNSENGKLVKTLSGHTGWITALAFSGDREKFASGGGDNSIRIWDIESATCLKILMGHKEPVLSLLFLEGGKKLLSGSRDKTIRMWDVERGHCLAVLEGHKGWVSSLDWQEGKILSSSHDTTVRIWDGTTGECLKVFGNESSEAPQEKHIRSAAFYRGGQEIILCTREHRHYVLSAQTGECLKTEEGDIEARDMAREETSFYVRIRNLETCVVSKKTGQPVAFFPEVISSAQISKENRVTGVSQGAYVYMLELKGE